MRRQAGRQARGRPPSAPTGPGTSWATGSGHRVSPFKFGTPGDVCKQCLRLVGITVYKLKHSMEFPKMSSAPPSTPFSDLKLYTPREKGAGEDHIEN